MAFLRNFLLETYFSRWEFNCRHNLCASDVQSMTISELLALAEPPDREAWDRLSLGYTESFGAPALLQEIADGYQSVSAEEVLCFAGAEEGIYCAMHALLGPDDHAVVVTPNYQSLETVALGICAVTGVPLDPAHGWALDLDRLTDSLRPNTRLVTVNFPHNPTGKLIPRSAQDELVAICRDRGIRLFSDEVYRLLEHDRARRLPPAIDVYEDALSLGVMSKSYGLPGLRIGWIACRDRELLVQMERAKHYLSICNSAPSEMLALIALKARHTILERNRALVAANLEILERFMADHHELFDWYTPDGGCIVFPRYLGTDGVEAFAARLVEETGVLLLPSSNFRSDLNEVLADRFRVGFGRADFPEGVEVWRRFIGG